MNNQNLDVLWDDNPVDITNEANFIWSNANKLRSVYMPDKYGDVIIPMTIIRRLECALLATKDKVVSLFKEDPSAPEKLLTRASGFQFYNTSEFSLKELLNDPDHIETNFISYINSFSSNVQQLLNAEDSLNMSAHIKTMNKGGCLYSVVKAFSEIDLSPETFDSIKMGYIFENLIGRFFQNVDAGQFYLWLLCNMFNVNVNNQKCLSPFLAYFLSSWSIVGNFISSFVAIYCELLINFLSRCSTSKTSSIAAA